MALDSLTARANTGAGTDQIAGEDTPAGFAAAVVGTDGTNAERLATEATLAALNAKVATTPSGALLTGTARDRFFDNFPEFDTVNNWEVVQTGTGMAITGPLGGAAAGSTPYLNIASGTTINQKTIILSRDVFSAPVDLRYQLTASQRIANNRFLIGFVQVDESGAIVTSTSITAAPDVLNARNAVMHQHDGTTATTAQLRVRAAGSAADTFANAFGTGTTAATGSAPNWIVSATYGLTFERDRINSRAYGQNVLTNTGGQFGYDRVIPNPTVLYKIAIIVENLGVAPASSTDWRLHLVNVLDATRFDVSPRNAGTTDAGKAFPVAVVQAASTPVTMTSTTITSGVISPLTVAGASAEASAARTASGNSAAALTNASGTNAHFIVNVSAVSGTTPSLQVRVQVQDPVSLNWVDLPSAVSAAMNTISTTLFTVTNLPRTYRLAWTITGTTPSFTFSVGILPVI